MLTVAGALLLLAGFVWLWWQGVPALFRNTSGVSPADQLKATTDTRMALLAGLAAIGALGTFWLNASTQRFTAETLQISEANFRLAERSQNDSFKLTERGHLTDRYAKAIEQLGDDNLDVRLRGIYALEQLATDSPRDRDQATIVEVLSAFVRVHSGPPYQYEASLPKDAPPEPAKEQSRKAAEYVGECERPPVDVQAAVTVLGRLPLRPGVQRADLSGAHLSKVKLSKAKLTEADLTNANLTRAFLAMADLTSAQLYGADLTGANLTGVDLPGAWLQKADLTKANLYGADLTRASLFKADLTGADFSGADLGAVYGLSQEQLDGAIGDGYTTVPARLSRPELWRGK